MATIKYITIEEFAGFHKITTQLIQDFADFGLIEIRQVEKKHCIFSEQIEHCERAIRLHRDLGVNKEGIEIILDMRSKQTLLQQELMRLRHQLNKHEERVSKMFSEEL